MFTIKFKIILAYTVVFGLMLTIFAGLIYHNIKEASFIKLDTNLKSYSISLQTEIEDEFDDSNSLNIKRLNSIRAKGLYGERFQLFDKKGNCIVSDSILSKFSIIDFAKAKKNAFEYKKQKIDHRKYRILWSTFETEKDTKYVLETATSVKDVYEELDKLLYLFLFLIPAGLIVTGIAAYFISNAAFKPIAQMANTARNISAENLDKRLDLPKARDEVRSLGITLNEMIERIDSAFKSQKRFIANASHEIRTPLTVIQTELEILEKKIKDNESNEGIKNALSEIEDLTKLTNSLLIIAKLDSSQTKLNLKNVRIDELLAECSQSLNKAAVKKGLLINLSIDDPVEIVADKEKIKSVFLNLIDNAIKYSYNNQIVTIDLQKISDNKIQICFENIGRGISTEEIPFIFNRFYRSNEVRAEISGHGLGLAIAKDIIDLHKGEVTVVSDAGNKTIFKVVLPINFA